MSSSDDDAVSDDDAATAGDSLDYSPESIVTEVLTQLEKAGWNFDSLLQNTTVFDIDSSRTPTIHPAGHRGPGPSLDLNYPILTFLMNGQYYSDYKSVFGMMGFPVMCERR